MTTLSQLSIGNENVSSNLVSSVVAAEDSDDGYVWMAQVENSQEGVMVGRSVVDDMETDSDEDYAWMMEIQNSLEGKMVGPIVEDIDMVSTNSDDDYAWMCDIDNSQEGIMVGRSVVRGDDDEEDDNEQWFLEEEWAQRGGGETVEDDAVPGPSHTVVSEKYKQEVKRFRTTGTAYDVRFENLDEVEDVQALARDTIQRQIDEARKNGNPGDLLGIEINHPALTTPVLIPFRDQEEQTADKVMHTIELVTQSKKDFKVDDGFLMKFTHVQPPRGSGGGARTFRGNFDKWLEKKANGHGSCFIKIDNSDNLCLARSLVTARAHAHRNGDGYQKGQSWRRWERVRKGDSNRYNNNNYHLFA